MRMYSAFFKKELTEITRTYKLFVLLAVFVLLGIMNPVMAKVMPDILKSVMPKGISITLATPTAFDSWAQFFKNASQTGLIIVVIIFSGIMSNEFSKGTLINMLTKGLSRPVVILSKFTAALSVWSASYILCFSVTYYYTDCFWHKANIENLYLSAVGLWVFGAFLIASLILGGVLFTNHFGGLLFTFGLVAVSMMISIAPELKKINPASLATLNTGLLSRQVDSAVFYPAIAVTGGLTVIFIILSVFLFNKKQI